MAVEKGEIGIYGVLKNDTPDGVIAYASQLRDESAGKDQQTINAETRAELERVASLAGDGAPLPITKEEIDALLSAAPE